jgi:RND family efflux transporter MFP subunit
LSLLGGVLLLSMVGCRGSTSQAEEEFEPATVAAEAAKTSELAEWTELLGTTQALPNSLARISAAVDGQVTLLDDKGKPLAKEGQQIKKGHVLARIDDRVIKANHEKSRRTLEDAKEQVNQAELALELATKTLEAMQKLKVSSPFDLEKARIAVEDAKSKKKGAAARCEVIKAELAAVDEQLKLYQLKSPIDGRVGLLQVAEGQFLTLGALVTDVVNLDTVEVLSFVPPYLVRRLKLGQTVRLTEPPEPDPKKPSGTVVFIASQADPETGNLPVKMRFPNKKLQLQANQVVRLEVETQPEKKRTVIRQLALMEDQDPPAVLVIFNKEKEAKKDDKGETYYAYKCHKLEAEVGIREPGKEPAEDMIELKALRDPKTHKVVSVESVQFIYEGGRGLEEDDWVKLEQKETEKKE